MTLGYVTRRCGTFLLVVWVALTVNFVLPRVATPEVSRPRGDTVRPFLLDRPLWEQYAGRATAGGNRGSVDSDSSPNTRSNSGVVR